MQLLLCNKKLIAVSCALAAAGILACAVAVVDTLLPRGSLVGFLTGMALLSFVVTGVVIGYTWVCDQCERYVSGGRDRLLHGSPERNPAAKPEPAVVPRPAEPKVVCDVAPTIELSPALDSPLMIDASPRIDVPRRRHSRVRRVPVLRGSVSSKLPR
jgi:hypothetical protein